MTSLDRIPGPHLVVGLGNPGPKYAATRHNIGQMVLDHIADAAGARFAAARRAQAVVVEGRLGIPGSDERVILAKLTTYMNTSGGPVKALASYYDIPAERIVVVHDEVDIPFDAIRLKRGGGEGGHNGLKSISAAIGSRDYVRLRVGIGRPPGRQDPADYVLRDFAVAERADLAVILEEAADGVRDLVENGLVLAQDRLHAPR